MPRRKLPASVILVVSIIACAVLSGLANAFDEAGALDKDPIENLFGIDRRAMWLATIAEQQRPDIVLVTIGESALRDYPSVAPISRKLLATLVTQIDSSNPKAIGLDIIIERPSIDDQSLVRAISGAKHPVVISALDDRYAGTGQAERSLIEEQLSAQEDFIRASSALAGHLWLEHKTGIFNQDDETVRYVAEPNVGHPARESFSYVLAKAASYDHQPTSKAISWLRPPKDHTTPLFAEITVRRHKPEELDRDLPLLSAAERTLLKGRVVLVGVDLVDRDRHKTSLFVLDGHRSPGVEIHAQAVAQIIDGNRDIWEIPRWGRLSLYFVIGAMGMAASRFRNIHQHKKVGALIVSLLGLAIVWVFKLDVPVSPVVAVGSFAVSILPWLETIQDKFPEYLLWARRRLTFPQIRSE